MMRYLIRILPFAALICLSTQARADLLGDTINFGIYDGATNQSYAFNLGTIVVPGAANAFGFTTTITGSTITIAEEPSHNTICNSFNAGDVCGVVFTDSTKDPGYASITLDPASTTTKLTPSFGDNAIYLDFTNLTLDAGDVATFDLTFNNSVSASATPEPSGLVLLGTGVLGVAGAMRKRLFKR